ncbi:MAG: hypothetical protein NTW19_08355 [Planctomycetota bacterium]|nr:hypothetical protein [Planctomycetota bacterium]
MRNFLGLAVPDRVVNRLIVHSLEVTALAFVVGVVVGVMMVPRRNAFEAAQIYSWVAVLVGNLVYWSGVMLVGFAIFLARKWVALFGRPVLWRRRPAAERGQATLFAPEVVRVDLSMAA